MNKIIIIGCPASGKSTLGNKLANILDIPIFHLDKIFWIQPGGIKQDIFFAKQKEIIKGNEKWIIDGDFVRSKSFDFRVENSDLIVIYELSKILIYWRLFKRFVKDYGKTRSDMPENRKETFKTMFGVIKYIWSYNNDFAVEKIDKVGMKDKIVLIKSTEDEINFLRRF